MSSNVQLLQIDSWLAVVTDQYMFKKNLCCKQHFRMYFLVKKWLYFDWISLDFVLRVRLTISQPLCQLKASGDPDHDELMKNLMIMYVLPYNMSSKQQNA